MQGWQRIMTQSIRHRVVKKSGLYYDYLCIEGYRDRILYVHKFQSCYVVSKSFSPGLDRWLVIDGKDQFKSIRELEEALNVRR